MDSRIGLVYADPARVLQVLLNLLDNAIKFTPTGGSVTVKAFSSRRGPSAASISRSRTQVKGSARNQSADLRADVSRPECGGQQPQGSGTGTLHCAGTGAPPQRPHLGRKPTQPRQHVFLYPSAVFAGKAVVAGHYRSGPVTRSAHARSGRTHSAGHARDGHWEHTHEQCLTLLRGCILPAKDIILPALAASGQSEQFLIVASTDAEGAAVLTKRIAGQLRACRNYAPALASRFPRPRSILLLVPAGSPWKSWSRT